MNRFAVSLFPLALMAAAHGQEGSAMSTVPTMADVRAVSPALGQYTQELLLHELWQRPELSPRDRSIAILSTLIARNQQAGLSFHLELALDNGVTPAEVSELITHLAFYTGWGNAMSAILATRAVFAARNIDAGQLPAAAGDRLPLDEAGEARREALVAQNFGAVAPGVVHYTTAALFRDLWLRPGLAPRDRSLVTVSALIASGKVEQIPFHLNKAMDNGLTQAQAAEVLTHLAFYAGWPNVFSALPVAKRCSRDVATKPGLVRAIYEQGS